MLGIVEIGCYVPTRRVDNHQRQAQFSIDANFIQTKIGFERLSRKADDEETSDLCVRAFENLNEKHTVDPSTIDCVIVVTQNPDAGGIPHTAAIVQHKLGLPGDSSGFDVSLGCSGYVYGLDITKAYMAANGFRRGLLFTADPYSKILDPSDRNTELLFGDAATCTLMGETPRYTVGKPVYATDGGKGSYISRATAQSKLAMNGKEVFMFVLKNVPGQVRACLEAEGLPSSEVGLFVFHQGSRYMVENLAKTLQLDPERVPFLASEVGNTVSSTIPLILSDYIGDGPAHVLLSGFGVGLSAASVILKRDNS